MAETSLYPLDTSTVPNLENVLKYVPYARSLNSWNLRVYVWSKVTNMSNGVGSVLTDAEFRSITGHSFTQGQDFVYLSNGDELATKVNGVPTTFTTPNFNPSNKTIYTWSISSKMEPGNKQGVVRMDILVLTTH